MLAATDRCFGSFRLDPVGQTLWREEQLMVLTPKAFAVLAYLSERPGQLVTKAEFFQRLWPETVVGDATLTVCVHEIRRLLNDHPQSPRFIETVHTRGYRFVAELNEPLPIETADNTQTGYEDGAKEQPPERVTGVPGPAPGILLGRNAELAQLQSYFEKVLAGERQIVFVTGEPGIGKTTLVERFITQTCRAYTDHIGLGECIDHYGSGEAYLPVLAALAELCRQPGGERIIPVLMQRAPSWLVQMPGLLGADALAALQQRTQGADRNRMLREIADALEVLATERPLVLWLEDLHWSDYATLDLIAYLARLRWPAHLLLIGTYRPVDVILNSHPLKTVKQELQMHGQCQELPMEGLGPEAVAEYLAARFPEHRFGAKLSQTLYECTEGNPLFLTNVVEDWEERGILKRSGGIWTADHSVANARQSIPASLRDMLERQIDGLASEERALLEAASIVGMEFSPAAIAAGLAADVEQIEQQCEVLTRKRQYLRRSSATAGEQASTHYSFLHALFRRTWEEQIPPTRLARLHLRIGAYKEAEYGERCGDIASELAHHFYSANDAIKAIGYFRLAGERATARGAMVEGERHYARALELIGALPEDRERDRSELQLLLAAGPVLIALKGFGSPEAERAYTRALELCELLDNPPELYPASFGLWVMYFLRGEFTKAYALAEQLLHRAQISSELTPLPLAEMALGNASYQMGMLSLARKHVEQAMSHYDPDLHGPATIRDMGFDARVSGLSAIALTLWHLGYPDQALARAKEGLALAQGLSHLHSLAHAEFFVGFVHQYRREASAARAHAESVIALSAEQGFALWSAWATTLRGSAMTQQGHREEGVSQIQDGLAMSLAAGIKLSRPDFLCMMAEVQMEAGRLDHALHALTEALAAADEHENRLCEAEGYRLKGELLLKQGHTERTKARQTSRQDVLVIGDSNAAEARSSFERAIGITRKQSAKSWELRATTSLARLLAKQGQTENARRMLADIYNWFTEGFDTKDLQEAKQLLDTLS